MDAQMLNQVLAVMEEQMKIMADLTALSRKKAQLLVDVNIDELDVILRGEQALIWQMGRLEDRRFKLQIEMAGQLGIHPSQLTLERLLVVITPESGDRCQSVAECYARTAGELGEVNQLNSELIQQAMAHVDFSLQLLGASGPAGAKVYSPQGPRPVRQDGRHRRLDNRV